MSYFTIQTLHPNYLDWATKYASAIYSITSQTNNKNITEEQHNKAIEIVANIESLNSNELLFFIEKNTQNEMNFIEQLIYQISCLFKTIDKNHNVNLQREYLTIILGNKINLPLRVATQYSTYWDDKK